MKKSIWIKILILFTAFPGYLSAQDRIQLEPAEIRITVDKVPPVVKAAVIRDFGEDHKPVVWANSHSKFDLFGWEQNVNPDKQEINYYTVHTHKSNGSYLEAVYTPDGALQRSREEIKNFIPSRQMLATLQKSEFKDWSIDKNVHIIRAYEGKITKEHYDFKMQKGKQKKNVYFDKDGNMVMNKKDLTR